MGAASTQPPPAGGHGAVPGAPNLLKGFTDPFTSRYIDTGELRPPAVVGGDGHCVAAEAPEQMLAALRNFLAPYHVRGGGLR